MNYGVIIRSTKKEIIEENEQKDISDRIPNIDFDQINKDLKMYGITIISISNLTHCKRLKEVLDDKLIPPITSIILKESKLIDLPMEEVFHDNYEIIMKRTKVDPTQLYELLKSVFGCSREASARIYNNSITNNESSLGDFPLELAELKMQQLNRINERKNPPLVVFKLRKIN